MADPIISEEVMINIDNVSMRFNMAKEKVDSVKEWFIRRVKGTMKFEEFFALRNVSLQVNKGDVYGIVGLNGSGKSTLLKIVAGVMKPSAGSCKVHGSVAPLIELGAGFDMDLTGKENIYLNGTVLGMDPRYIDEQYEDIVEFSELKDFLNIAVKNYSSGMAARLGFSIATVVRPDVLIVDEILSVGDYAFQKKCEKRMNELLSGGTTLLYVSHSVESVKNLCSYALWLEKGEEKMRGDATTVCDSYIKALES